MFWIDVKRVIRSGYRNFMRSGFTSLTSVLMMTVTLVVITGILFLQATLQTSLANVRDKVDVTVYFLPDTAESNVLSVQTELNKLPEVADIKYISQDQALIDFKERHANDYLTLQAIDLVGDNPLGASLNIKAKDPSQYEAISKYFEENNALSKEAMTVIDKIDYHQNKIVIDRLSAILSGAHRLGFAITLIFVIVSLAITFNTIKLIIYMSREEISVMRLVGAANKYIRGPFIVSGVLVGIFSTIITIILFWPISIWLGSQMTEFLGINLLSYYASNFFQLFFILLTIGVILGTISSVLAIHKYLRR